MILRFTASNLVAMILFIPILLTLAFVFAFIVPMLALIIAIAGILFTALYVFAKIGLVKKQQVHISGSGGEHASKSHKKEKSAVEVKDYKIR